MLRSLLAGLVAVTAVACSTADDPPPIASRSTAATPTASSPTTPAATSPTRDPGSVPVSPDPADESPPDPPDQADDPQPDPTPEPTDGPTESPSTVATAAVLPEGFERTAAQVTEPDGSVCELCLWLADDADRRSRGLMFVTDLGPADGMAFVYPEARTSRFWMKNTLLPLSIAFFGADGAFLSAFDMEPCTADPCPRYRTAPDFLVAVETVQGGLPAIGIVPGSTLELLERPC